MDHGNEIFGHAIGAEASDLVLPRKRFDEPGRPAWLRYGAAVLASAATLAFTLAFRPILQGSLFLPAFLGVLFAGWFGGAGPGTVATLLSAAAIDYLLLAPAGSLRIAESGDAMRLALYLVVAAGITFLNREHWRAKRQRAGLVLEADRSRARIDVSKRSIERILEELTVGFCSLDRGYRYLYVNREAERILGRSRAELLGKNALETHPPSEEVVRALRTTIERGERTELEAFSPGLGRWLEIHVAPSDDGASFLFRDTTERKSSEEALHRMAAIVESSEDAIIAKNLEGVIIAWNRGAERLLGYSADEIIGQPISRLMPPERRDDMNSILGRIRRGERVEHFETVRVTKSGHHVPISVSVSPIKDGNGVVVGAAKIARDISERLRAERAIAEAQRQLAMALNAARMGTWSWDIVTGELEWSEKLLAIHGFAPGEFAGTYEAFLGCIHPDDRGNVADSVRKAVEERATYDTEFRVPFRDGSLHWVAGHGQVFVDTQGAPTRMIGIGRDITDRKNSEMERESLLREAREAVQTRDDFLSVAGHEFRTPLGALDLMLHNLSQKAERRNDTESVTALNRVQRQVERLVRLTEQLLEVGRIQARKLAIEKEPVELESLIRDVIERLEETTRRAGTPISFDAPEPVQGLWDRSRVDQVVTNLLTNAIKFGPGRPIEVALRQNGDDARISVRDHGIGISGEDQKRIFERFERAVSDRSYSGIGLGLWISRQIVEAHGGRIGVESTPGEGATFEVVLPELLPRERADANSDRR